MNYEILEILEMIKYKNIVNIEPDNLFKMELILKKLIIEKIQFKKIKNFGSNNIGGLLKENKNNLKKIDNIIKIEKL